VPCHLLQGSHKKTKTNQKKKKKKTHQTQKKKREIWVLTGRRVTSTEASGASPGLRGSNLEGGQRGEKEGGKIPRE